MSPSTYTLAVDEFLPPRPRTVSDFDPIFEIRRIRESLATVFTTADTKPVNIHETICDDWHPADATCYIPARTIREATPSARATIAPLAEFSPQLDLPPRDPDRERQIIARLRNQLADATPQRTANTTHESQPQTISKAVSEPTVVEHIAAAPVASVIVESIVAETSVQSDAWDAVAVLSALGLILAAVGGFCLGCGLHNQSDFLRNVGLQSTLTGLVLITAPYLPLTTGNVSRRAANAEQRGDERF